MIEIPSPELIQSVRDEVPGAYDLLLSQSTGLIKKLIQKFVRLTPEIDRDDLDQVARIFLLKAAQNWEPSRGSWPKFASAVIIQEIRWWLWRQKKQQVPIAADPDSGAAPEILPPPAKCFDRDTATAHLSDSTKLLLIEQQWYLCLVNERSYYLWEVGPEPTRIEVRREETRLRCDCPAAWRGRFCCHTKALSAMEAITPKPPEPVDRQQRLIEILRAQGGRSSVRTIRRQYHWVFPTVSDLERVAAPLIESGTLKIETVTRERNHPSVYLMLQDSGGN